jgi:dephospho-CoA kinase
MLVARGAHLIRADDIAHQLMQPGQPVYEQVVQHFGASIVHPDGTINRPKLAQAAFGSARVEELNRIVHPAVIAYQNAWMEEMGRKDPGAVVIVEAALILEAGVQGRFDKLIVVTCRAEQKPERFAGRQKLALADATAEVVRRTAAQIGDEQKIRAADFVIDNSGDLWVAEQQVDALWPELQRLAQERRS